jgi:hypothetical protein
VQFPPGLVSDPAPRGRQNAVLGAAIVATVAALGFTYLALDKLWISRRSVVVQSVASNARRAGAPHRLRLRRAAPVSPLSLQKPDYLFSGDLWSCALPNAAPTSSMI